MGLDTVELVLAFEDEFGITIEDEDAERLTTPGQVADYVVSRQTANTGDPCPTQAGFYRLRSTLMNMFAIPRADIHPHTPLHAILKGDAKKSWHRLRKAVGTERFPKLDRTTRFLVITVLLPPAVIAGSMFASGVSLSYVATAFGLLAVLAYVATDDMGTEIPPTLQTLDALVPYVRNTTSVRWTRQAALTKVIQITSDELGIERNAIHENSHFVRDLKAD